jgi:hypothetical protein
MANIKRVFGAIQNMTITNLNSLASSPTAGWQSAQVDNTTDLYLDALVQVKLDMANTAPGSSKGIFVYAAGGLETGVLSNPASGSQGAITLVDVTTTPQNLRQIGFIPYTTQDEVVESSPMSVAAAFGGVLPPYWSVVIINHSGAAIAASGNTVKYTPVYASV